MKVTASWYRDPKYIPKKVKHQWDKQEVKLVLDHKKQGISAAETAKALGGAKKGFTVTKIYNIRRLYRKGGLCCLCSRPLTAEEKKKTRKDQRLYKCSVCKRRLSRRKKRLRSKRLEAGLCVLCGFRKALSNRTTCRKCTSIHYRRRIVKRICGICGKRPVASRKSSTCTVCRRKSAVRGRELRKDRAAFSLR